MPVTIRPYREADLDDVYDVCVRTAAAGEDARGVYSDDHLMPDIFAGPYVVAEPELASVLDDGTRAVGYVIGTADTNRFAAWYRAVWIPRLSVRYEQPPDPPETIEDLMLALHYRPERLIAPELDRYPAHLHIDVLPEHQGAGHGRALIETFLAALAERDVRAVHLGMDPGNERARGFYDRLGFHEIPVEGAQGVLYLGRETS